ncbi:hypothetical protein [Pontibacter sp. G13]|uniref:hypothetical protein n=1 Tax=Pontibacter sp. G13 TaxID=3074898 RepID=UPI00288B6F62|nr:hypothetical protein [Pontibacter sp. G13]WNJ21186.1 hypothetical protein RJD25_12020 [Pontibacter sp. G13]
MLQIFQNDTGGVDLEIMHELRRSPIGANAGAVAMAVEDDVWGLEFGTERSANPFKTYCPLPSFQPAIGQGPRVGGRGGISQGLPSIQELP